MMFRLKFARIAAFCSFLLFQMAMPNSPGDILLFEDEFEGASDSQPDGAKWMIVSELAEPSVQLDGSGHLAMSGDGDDWENPSLISRFSFQPSGNFDYAIEWSFASVPDDPSICWVGIWTEPIGTGNSNRGFMIHPSMKLKMYTDSVGTGLSTNGHGVFCNVDFPSAQAFSLKMVLRMTGVLEWYVDTGQGWQQTTAQPIDPGSGSIPTTKDLDLLDRYDIAGAPAYRVVVNPNGCCATPGPFVLDRVSIKRLDGSPDGDQVPASSFIQGRLLSSSDEPVSGTHAYRLAFFDSQREGEKAGQDVEGVVFLDLRGRFNIEFAVPEEALSVQDLWAEVWIDSDDNGFEEQDRFQDRIQIGSVAFSRRAQNAYGVRWENVTGIPEGFSDNVDNSGELEGVYNVKSFGAFGDGFVDDTQAIQSAINAARTAGGTVYFPPGDYSVSSLNLTLLEKGVVLKGAGTGHKTSRILPNTSDVHLLDLTGSRYVNLENLHIGPYPQLDLVDLSNVFPRQIPTPLTAILLAQVESYKSNAVHFENLFVSGKFKIASIYCYGVPSSSMVNCDMYNLYEDSAAPVIWFTRENTAGVSSQFTAIFGGSPQMGGTNTSDWTLTGCEIHELANVWNIGGRTLSPSVRLHNTMQMRWIGGNISGAGPYYVHCTGENRWIAFVGTTFYSDFGPAANAVFHNEGTLSGFSVSSCQPAAGNVFSGVPGSVFNDIHYTGDPANMGVQNVFNAAGATLTNSIIHCNGVGLVLGNIASSNLLLNPGPISASSDQSFKIP